MGTTPSTDSPAVDVKRVEHLELMEPPPIPGNSLVKSQSEDTRSPPSPSLSRSTSVPHNPNARIDRAIDLVTQGDSAELSGDLACALDLRRAALGLLIEELKMAEPNSTRRRVLQVGLVLSYQSYR